MNVLITGGAGYVGYLLTEELSFRKDIDHIFVLDNLSKGNINFFLGNKKLDKVTFIKGDILDTSALEKALKNVNIVYHLAAYVAFPFNHLQNLQYEQINRWGTLNVVRAVQSAASVEKVIYLSSASVYGFRENISVHDEPEPSNAYGTSKYEGEKYVNLLSDYCKLSIIRAANVFGFNPSFRTDAVVNNFIIEGLTQKRIMLYGDGTQRRPFISLKKLVEELIASLDNQDKTQLKTVIEFNASLNDLKDWLLKHIPSIEYVYVNQNQKFPSQSFVGYPELIEDNDILDETFYDFSNNMRF